MKKIKILLPIIVSLLLFVGCASLQNNAPNLVFNGALITSSVVTIHNEYEDVSAIIANKLNVMEEKDANRIKEISEEFKEIKNTFSNLTNNATNVYKITMQLDQYDTVYENLTVNYTELKSILYKYKDKFTTVEWRELKRFDTEVIILNNQVAVLKQMIKETVSKSDVDITGILEKTLLILKTVATIVVMVQ